MTTNEQAADMIRRWQVSRFPVQCIVSGVHAWVQYCIVGIILECEPDIVIESADGCLSLLPQPFSTSADLIEIDTSDLTGATTIHARFPLCEVGISDIDVSEPRGA